MNKDKFLDRFAVFWSALLLIAVLLLLIYVITLPAVAGAEECPEEEWPQGRYTLITLPEIEESEWPAELFVAHIIRVELDWEAVTADHYLRVYLNLPCSGNQVYDVLLTDGQVWVHADIVQLGYSTLRLTFDAEMLRQMREETWKYLAVVAIV
ncbi:MAG: hypothetical protein IKN04_17810 [Clostridia bacterium]|nr:hypothetical protein [Clostridia bacterium]